MRRLIVAVMCALALAAASPVCAEVAPAEATDDYDETQSNPLRVMAYLVHPVGFTLEWLVFRPFHRLVSQPSLEPIFGHTSHADEASTQYK